MLYIAIIVVIFIGDYLIKNHVEKNENEQITRKILGGAFLIRKHHNSGFALNKGSNNRYLVTAVSLGMAVFCTLIYIITLGRKGNALLNTGFSILLGGAYSNTYDRLKRKFVVDYFSFGIPIKPVRSIIFNISDICIMIGAMICIIASD